MWRSYSNRRFYVNFLLIWKGQYVRPIVIIWFSLLPICLNQLMNYMSKTTIPFSLWLVYLDYSIHSILKLLNRWNGLIYSVVDVRDAELSNKRLRLIKAIIQTIYNIIFNHLLKKLNVKWKDSDCRFRNHSKIKFIILQHRIWSNEITLL